MAAAVASQDKFLKIYGPCTDASCAKPHGISISKYKMHADTPCFRIFNTTLLPATETRFSCAVLFWDSATVKGDLLYVTDATLAGRVYKERENDVFSDDLLKTISTFILAKLKSKFKF
jgi:hypothetical protein